MGTGKETEEANLLQQLSDACLVVDALEPSVREELVKNFCNKELTSYRQIFEGAGEMKWIILMFMFFIVIVLISFFISPNIYDSIHGEYGVGGKILSD